MEILLSVVFVVLSLYFILFSTSGGTSNQRDEERSQAIMREQFRLRNLGDANWRDNGYTSATGRSVPRKRII